MKTFASIIEELKKLGPVWDRIVRQDIIQCRMENGAPKYVFALEKDPALRPFIEGIWQDRGISGIEECHCCAHFMAEGPKIFRPTVEQCAVLQQVQPRLTVGEYRQPYPTMAVELPDRYRHWLQTRLTEQSSAGPLTQLAEPVAVILHHEPEIPALYSSVAWSSGFSMVRTMHHFSGFATIAAIFEANEPINPGSLPVEEQEAAITLRVLRVAINCLLLLTQYGCRAVGPDNPSHRARLARYLEKAQKRRDGIDEAERNLRHVPLVYDFAQHVALHEERPARLSDEQRAGGWSVKPHWRRGHMRRQPFGPGRAERKLVFIRPVLIHKETMPAAGKLTTTYHADPGEVAEIRQEKNRQQRIEDMLLEAMVLGDALEEKTNG